MAARAEARVAQGEHRARAVPDRGDETQGASTPEIEAQMATLQAVISAARTVRSEHEVDTKADVPLRVRTDVPERASLLRGARRGHRAAREDAGATRRSRPPAARARRGRR